jgi:hypothetical protein
MNLLELQTKIHEQNKAVGWWDNPRPFSTFACLFHSELSEAMEGDRKNLMDDHLPEYEMFWVEVADFVIRVLDFMGYVEFTKHREVTDHGYQSRMYFLEGMHEHVSYASRSYRNGQPYLSGMAWAIQACFAASLGEGVDLEKIILEKTAYNLTRADHKRENRALDNGKKY